VTARGPRTASRPRERVAAAVFYGGLLAVVAATLLQLLPLVLPGAVAGRVGRNSEGFLLALLLAGWVQLARPRLRGSPREWSVTLAAAAVCVLAALVLLGSDLPSRIRTLNETFLAAALVVPYLQLRRPLPPRLAAGLSLGVLAVVVLLHRTALVTDLAETLGVLLLVPVAFDLVDRGILDRRARTSTALRCSWYALLALVPVLFAVLQHGLGVEGTLGEATRYGVRLTEAFLCLLLVELYLAVALRRTGAGARP